jgi:hypothetical protein
MDAPAETDFDGRWVGSLPGSSYGIRLGISELVTHNAAILGILGAGKTVLAFELIRRMILARVKVVVLDISGEYGRHFRDVFPQALENSIVEGIAAVIREHAATTTKNVHEGGNIRQFAIAVREELDSFIKGNDPVRVFNPNAFQVVRQDSKPYADLASMAPLTGAEVTRVFAEQLLASVATEPSSTARVCLVLEEAHALVPEWSSTAYEPDRQASNGTAQAILQGRKFGLGVLIITQRTANVTKTVLNQCNTVFAFRIFDATGMEFLSNYIGNAYANILSSLAERQLVLFGRASSSPNPVMVQVNDQADLLGWYSQQRDAAPTPDPTFITEAQFHVLADEDSSADSGAD